LAKELEANRIGFFFLVNNDPPLEEIFTEHGKTWKLIKELHLWPGKVNDELEKADTRHREDRDRIEEELANKKEVFEHETIKLDEKVKLIGPARDMNEKEGMAWAIYESYKMNSMRIKELMEDIRVQEDIKHKIVAEELALFGAKPEFKALAAIIRDFEPYYELWTKIDIMQTSKNRWN
jgi:hypothetical protein